MYSDHIGGVVVPFPQAARAPGLRRSDPIAAESPRGDVKPASRPAAGEFIRALAGWIGDALVVALMVAAGVVNALLLLSAFGIRL